MSKAIPGYIDLFMYMIFIAIYYLYIVPQGSEETQNYKNNHINK